MFNHKDYQQQLQQKLNLLSSLLKPFNSTTINCYSSPIKHFRQRAEFRIWRTKDNTLHYAMFEPGSNKTPILMEQFEIASEKINQLMLQLKQAWQQNPLIANHLFQVEFLTGLSQDSLITLCYRKKLDDNWLQIATQLSKQLNCQIVGRSHKQRLVVERDYIIEKLNILGKNYIYQQVEGSFSQPNAYVNQSMISWACQKLGNIDKDLLELYCGNGNFTIPFAGQVTKVLASEISKTSIRAAINNCQLNNIANIKLARLSAEELTQALNKQREFNRLIQAKINLNQYDFDTVFVDPPRAGIDPISCQLLQKFNRIIYISCNPNSLANNLMQLCTTHKVTSVALFDQFPYTKHIEAGVLLNKIS